MPRTRDQDEHEATKAQIKAIARAQMTQYGTGGLSLRAIAREMDMTAPALYRYYPSLDDLITALIVDAFNGIADAAEMGDLAVADRADYEGRLMSACLAYRQWALEHPVDFQLIYGNPIPGYVAPREITVPAATRTNIALTRILIEANGAGQYHSPYAVPFGLEAATIEHAKQIAQPYEVDADLVVAGLELWEIIYGAIFSELFGQSPPIIGASGVVDLYKNRVRRFFHNRR